WPDEGPARLRRRRAGLYGFPRRPALFHRGRAAHARGRGQMREGHLVVRQRVGLFLPRARFDKFPRRERTVEKQLPWQTLPASELKLPAARGATALRVPSVT